jgi:hypothetical protein
MASTDKPVPSVHLIQWQGQVHETGLKISVAEQVTAPFSKYNIPIRMYYHRNSL